MTVVLHPKALDLVDNVRQVLDLGAPSIALAPVFESVWRGTEATVEEQYQGLADWYIAEARAGRILPLDITNMLLLDFHRNQDSGKRPSAPCGIGGHKKLVGIDPDGNVMCPATVFCTAPTTGWARWTSRSCRTSGCRSCTWPPKTSSDATAAWPLPCAAAAAPW